MTSKISSIPRRHILWLILTLIAGWYFSGWIAGADQSLIKDKWSGYSSVLASASASMVSLLVAITALIYALLSTPLLKLLHERGAINRVLFDLMASASIWLVALMLCIFSAHPGIEDPTLLMRIASASAIAGAAHFIPIGRAFWLLLKNSDATPSPSVKHDFRKPTKLD